MLRPIETNNVIKDYTTKSFEWFIDYFLRYNDDEDCKYIFKNLPQYYQDGINEKIRECVDEIQKQRDEIQKQRDEIQKQRDETRAKIKVVEDLNEIVLKQIEITRELRQQLI